MVTYLLTDNRIPTGYVAFSPPGHESSGFFSLLTAKPRSVCVFSFLKAAFLRAGSGTKNPRDSRHHAVLLSDDLSVPEAYCNNKLLSLTKALQKVAELSFCFFSHLTA